MAREVVCRSCGSVGKAKKITPGSLFTELILWLLMILPGLLYTIWRHTKRHEGCSACGSSEIIPVASPMGKKLLQEMTPP